MILSRGDICIADLNPVRGSEQSGIRPVIVLQNDDISRFSSTVIIIPLTSNTRRAKLPSCISLLPGETGLEHESAALCHQIRAIDRTRLRKIIGSLNYSKLFELEAALLYTLGFE